MKRALDIVSGCPMPIADYPHVLLAHGADVQEAYETLGLAPGYISNEGRFIAFVPAPKAARALTIRQAHPLGREASIIGKVARVSKPASRMGVVTMQTAIGFTRIIDGLSGEQLPRMC